MNDQNMNDQGTNMNSQNQNQPETDQNSPEMTKMTDALDLWSSLKSVNENLPKDLIFEELTAPAMQQI